MIIAVGTYCVARPVITNYITNPNSTNTKKYNPYVPQGVRGAATGKGADAKVGNACICMTAGKTNLSTCGEKE